MSNGLGTIISISMDQKNPISLKFKEGLRYYKEIQGRLFYMERHYYWCFHWWAKDFSQVPKSESGKGMLYDGLHVKMDIIPIFGRFVWTIYLVKCVCNFEWNHAKLQKWWLYSWRRFRFGTRRQKTYNKDFSFHDPRTNLTINCILPRESLKTKIANSFA